MTSDNGILKSDRAASLLLICVGLGYFIALLDITLINVALPVISARLRLDPFQLSMVANAYTWALVIALPIGGRSGDLIGRRRLFLLAVGGLGVFGIVGGSSSALSLILLSRIGLGFCAGLMLPQTLTLIRAGFPSERRGWALGVWGSIGGTASITGPLVGGALVTWLGWHAIFLVNVPAALIVMISTLLWVPADPHPSRIQDVDLLGAILLSAVAALIGSGLLVLGDGNVTPGSALMFGGIILLVGLIRHEKHLSAAAAVVPRSLIFSASFLCLCGVGAVASAGVFAITFIISAYAQDVAGLTAFVAGMCVLPASLVSVLTSPRAGHAMDRGRGRVSVFLGMAYAIGAFLLLQQAVVANDIWLVAVSASIFGMANGLLIPTLTAMALRIATDDVAGAASALIIITRQFGALVGGLAATGALMVQGLSLRDVTGTALSGAIPLFVLINLGGLVWFALLGPAAERRRTHEAN